MLWSGCRYPTLFTSQPASRVAPASIRSDPTRPVDARLPGTSVHTRLLAFAFAFAFTLAVDSDAVFTFSPTAVLVARPYPIGLELSDERSPHSCLQLSITRGVDRKLGAETQEATAREVEYQLQRVAHWSPTCPAISAH
ncbi:hypothetical protein C446_07664 [Halobiforma nitratireducens JCM 10879]|uniref:Uncharacterized protein n=1 Tax=Halobiforma nitratireducens JCM 10879 TaxID=1227454 RepID=M0M6P4_9EURY|nr:hypothetical protein C446_07664 [Halobiforma nitratireducens JCM 10879]